MESKIGKRIASKREYIKREYIKAQTRKALLEGLQGNRLDLNVEEFLGTSIYSVASNPERVDSFLIHRVDTTESKPDFICHNIIASGPALDAEQVQLLAGLIQNAGSYWFGKPQCVPERNFALRLWRGDTSVDMLIAFNCAAWDFFSLGHRQRSFCFPIRGELLQLAKSLFPEYASPLRRSAWKQGAIKRLVENSQR